MNGSETALVRALVANVTNSASIRPDIPVEISVYMSLQKTLSLTTTGVLTLSTLMSLSWKDPRLSWNTSEYAFNTTNIAKNAVWTPSLTLVNSVASTDLVVPSSVFGVIVTYTGLVSLVFNTLLTSSCSMDLSSFPFDTQECRLRIISLDINYDSPNIRFTNYSDWDIDHYSQNGEFTLTSVSVNVSDDATSEGEFKFTYFTFPAINVTISYARQSSYYISTMIAPAFIIILLLAFTLIIPSENSIKVSVSCTLLLALYTLQQSVARVLPPSGKSSALANGIFSCLFLAGCTVLLVILTVVFKMLGPSFFVKCWNVHCKKVTEYLSESHHVAPIEDGQKDDKKFTVTKGEERFGADGTKGPLEEKLEQLVILQQKMLSLMESQHAHLTEAAMKQKETTKTNDTHRNVDMILASLFFLCYLVAALACLISYMT